MADLKPITGRPPRGSARRWGWRCLFGMVTMVLVLGTVFGVTAIRLSNGPMRIDGLSASVAEAVAERIGPGWSIAIRGSSLELDRENALALRFTGLDIRNPQGALVVRAPLALVSLDPWGLLHLSLQPRSIEFRDTQTTALVHKDGSIAFAASEGAPPVDIAPPAPPGVDAVRGGASPLSAALASIVGVVLDPGGVVGALDRARITDAKMRLIDDDGRERAVFAKVNGLFGRDPVNGTRSFELRLDGPHGQWRFGGSLHENGEGARSGLITLDDLPLTDLLLLAGQSGMPLTTDLKLSARADVALVDGRVTTMTARVHTGDGMFLIEEKDFNPVTIDDLTATLSWDEAARTMALTGLDYSGAGNALHLSGSWAQSPAGTDSAWTASLSGRDGLLRGATAKDVPVRLDTLDTHLTGRNGGIVIDDFALTGPGVKGHITGTVGTEADDGGINLRIQAREGEVRTFLRLWPEHIAPAVRYYLADQLRGGRVDTADMRVVMTGREIAEATKGAPLPDKGLSIAFKVSDAAIDVSSEAPPVVKGSVTGLITGRTTTIRNVTGEVKGVDGRALTLSDGSFVIPEASPDHVVAQIGLRLSGGADGLASVLESKLFRSLMSVDLDPAAVRGSADLRVDFPLDLKHIPDLPDIPITLTGSLNDLSVDKVVGKDKLEGGRFSVAYDKGSFALKGEGRVGGAPLTVDMHQPKVGAPGEAVISLALDEALRTRKGLPGAPQLTGTIPVRAVVPIGKPGGGKPTIRVEADLAKAGIDGVLPGFTKAAGKPGKLAFTLSDRETGYDLRDIALDAGPATVRGSAVIGAEGGLEKAELTSVKLSPGDDMRVTLDRSGGGYKVVVRGAVADARPFLKSLTGPEGKGGKEANPKDVDADIQLPIITGFNEEALTNASLKLSLRGRDLRAATITGRFRTAQLLANVTRGERGVPTLAVESGDAGATLRFVDIYRRMYGGHLAAGIGLNDGPQAGVVQIRDFVLRNEPALSSIMAQGPDPVEGESARGRKSVASNAGQTTGSVTFDRMRANFVRSGTRVDFTDAAISNPALGFTLSGWLDTARERTDIAGTFVPLYGLNNVAAQLPIVGPLLGGGNNEGLFAVNFRVSGRLTNPDVTVNPLSAIAPGFLRKLFSAGGGPFAEQAPGTR